MAVTITEVAEGFLLNAYNNSIIEFGLDEGTPARAIIFLHGYRFEITPNKGVFHFDIAPVVRILINQDAFSDTVDVTGTGFVYPDRNLFIVIDTEITVFDTAANVHTASFQRYYIKGVNQLIPDHYSKIEILRMLSPSNDNLKSLTYFEGYPFDFPVYANQSAAATIKNTRTGSTINVNLNQGVNRIFVSNGENDNNGFESAIPLSLGINFLEVTFQSKSFIVSIEKRPVRCGVYLKWFNTEGAWSYWLFESLHTGKISHKTIGTLNRDYKNISKTMAREIITGKTANKELSLNTGIIDSSQRRILEEIYASPKCYMYSNLELQPFKAVDFKAVKVKDGTNDIINTKLNHNRFEVDIELPQLYTQTYAG